MISYATLRTVSKLHSILSPEFVTCVIVRKELTIGRTERRQTAMNNYTEHVCCAPQYTEFPRHKRSFTLVMASLASYKSIENKIVLKFIVHQLKAQYSVYAGLETAVVRYENSAGAVTGLFIYLFACFCKLRQTLGKGNKGVNRMKIGHVLSQFRENSFC